MEEFNGIWRNEERVFECYVCGGVNCTSLQCARAIERIKWLSVIAVISIVFLMLLTIRRAEAQYVNPFVGRPVAQFGEGQEYECLLHWQEDLAILRQWQQENSHWVGKYNDCAEDLGLGLDYWLENPTLRNYPVDPDIIAKEVADGKYVTFLKACNSHIFFAHHTEFQFAHDTYQVHINYCHCRENKGIDRCTPDFIARFPYRYARRT